MGTSRTFYNKCDNLYINLSMKTLPVYFMFKNVLSTLFSMETLHHVVPGVGVGPQY